LPGVLDTLVIGDGPAGAAFTVAAAAAGLRVGLASRQRASTTGETLEPTVERALRALGVWDLCRSAAKPLSGALSVWDDLEVVERPGILDVRGPHLGVDRARFDAPLRALACDKSVAVIGSVRSLREEDGVWKALDAAGAVARARLLVIATGRSGCPIGRGARDRNDRLVALMSCASSRAGAPTEFVTEATEDGWWYASPLPGVRSVVTYMTDADLLPRGGLAAVEEAWRSALRRTRLAAVFQSPDRPVSLVARPAGGSIRHRIAGDNWIAVGDAAAAYDPICGQGVPAALAKGMGAARLLASESSCAVAMRAYVEAERDAFSSYLASRRHVYERVRSRFSDRPFWRRRI
jgi:2-polyprenyl-6-methoxyphenol hydroxylase-like FAD-dependent oxidoreductase